MSEKQPGDDDAGRFAYEGLDRVLHEKARLGILTALVTHPDGTRPASAAASSSTPAAR